MRGIVMPKDTRRAYTIVSDMLLYIAEYAEDIRNPEDRYTVLAMCYETIAKVLRMANDPDPEQVQRDLQWKSDADLMDTVPADYNVNISSTTTSVEDALGTMGPVHLSPKLVNTVVEDQHAPVVHTGSSYVFDPEDGKRVEQGYD